MLPKSITAAPPDELLTVEMVKGLMQEQENKYQTMFNQMYHQIMAISMTPQQQEFLDSMETDGGGAPVEGTI